MADRVLASLSWRVRQGERFASTSLVMPAESAARVATTLLREFAGKSFTPLEVSVAEGETTRFAYITDRMTLRLRRLPPRT